MKETRNSHKTITQEPYLCESPMETLAPVTYPALPTIIYCYGEDMQGTL